MDIYKWIATLERPISKNKQWIKNSFQEGGLLDTFLHVGVYNSQ